MCKCIQYVYVCVDADVYVSLPLWMWWGVGGCYFSASSKTYYVSAISAKRFLLVQLFFDFECFFDFLLFDLLDWISFGLLTCVLVLHTGIWIPFQTTFS